MGYKYLFGPVPSRRLGVSLGIDLVPFKTCNLNCVYCECGAVKKQFSERKEYIPADKVISELRSALKTPLPDFATFSGGGEPTLNSGIGKIIRFIKSEYPKLKLALLTNGILLSDPGVREEVLPCDVVLPSVDAVFPEIFQRINRPHSSIDLSGYLDGLMTFKEEFKGDLWVEVFLAKGINDSPEHLRALGEYLKELSPDRIQLNTLDRPSAEKGIHALTKEELRKVIEIIDNPATEIISKFSSRRDILSYAENTEKLIMDTLKRRPLTLDDLSSVTGLKIQELNKYLDVLEKEGQIYSEIGERGVFIVHGERKKQ